MLQNRSLNRSFGMKVRATDDTEPEGIPLAATPEARESEVGDGAADDANNFKEAYRRAESRVGPWETSNRHAHVASGKTVQCSHCYVVSFSN